MFPGAKRLPLGERRRESPALSQFLGGAEEFSIPTRVCHWLHWVRGQSRFHLIWRNSESKYCERQSMPTTSRGLSKEGDHEYNPGGARK